jgi:(E)-4-hydroxy-3-methylbut-2-enyl-diphosphate synthase
LLKNDCRLPVILSATGSYEDMESMQLGLSLDFGPLLIDGLGDGLLFRSVGGAGKSSRFPGASNALIKTLFTILQATRVRITRTEYISCPGCGRTLFDLQQTIAAIKARTAHLKGLKLGVMGCIVNGPGEMADADYGYVGAGPGRVALYKGKKCIERNIPASLAVDRLIDWLKVFGDWQEP